MLQYTTRVELRGPLVGVKVFRTNSTSANSGPPVEPRRAP